MLLFDHDQKQLPEFLSYSVGSRRHAHKISAGCCPGHFLHKGAAFFYSAVLADVFPGTWMPSSSGSPSSSLPVTLQAQLLQLFLKASPASPRLLWKWPFSTLKSQGIFAPLIRLSTDHFTQIFRMSLLSLLVLPYPALPMPLLPSALVTCGWLVSSDFIWHKLNSS